MGCDIMKKKVQIRRYDILRAANMAAGGYLVLAPLMALSFLIATGMHIGVGFSDFIQCCQEAPFVAAGVWASTAIIVLVYNHVLARFRIFRITIEIEDEE